LEFSTGLFIGGGSSGRGIIISFAKASARDTIEGDWIAGGKNGDRRGERGRGGLFIDQKNGPGDF
jgi:hypothetical protein